MRLIIFLPVVSCFVMFGCQTKSKDESKTPTTDTMVVEEDSLPTLVESVELPTEKQTFQLNFQKEQTIKGKDGTMITVPANCFGNDVKSATLELIECYNIQDMLFNGLATLTHDEKLLESEGMIYINVLDGNGDTLEIKNGEIQIEMPTPEKKDGFDLFAGITQKGKLKWQELKNKLIESKPIGKSVSEIVEVERVISESESSDSTTTNQITYGKPKMVFNNGKEYKVKDRELARYYFKISNLGWFNIDNFRSFPTSRLAVNVAPAYRKAMYYIVLKNYNSLLGNDHKPNSQGQVVFPKIPDSEPFTLIGFGAKAGELYFHMEDYEANPGSIDFPALEPITQQEMSRKLLEKFGKDIWSRPAA